MSRNKLHGVSYKKTTIFVLPGKSQISWVYIYYLLHKLCYIEMRSDFQSFH